MNLWVDERNPNRTEKKTVIERERYCLRSKRLWNKILQYLTLHSPISKPH